MCGRNIGVGCRVSGVGYREASPPPDTRHPTPIFYVLPCPPSPAGSTLPPTAAPCGSPPTAICPPKAIPACGSRACGGGAPSPPEKGKGRGGKGGPPPPPVVPPPLPSPVRGVPPAP